MIECKHCGKPIAQYRFNTSNKVTWLHVGTFRIYCVSRTKAEPKGEKE